MLYPKLSFNSNSFIEQCLRWATQSILIKLSSLIVGGEGREGYGKPKMRFDEVKYHIKGIKIMRVIMQFKSHRN